MRKNEKTHDNNQFLASLFLFVCFAALRPKSTAMAMVGRSDHLATLLEQPVSKYFVHILSFVTDNNPS